MHCTVIMSQTGCDTSLYLRNFMKWFTSFWKWFSHVSMMFESFQLCMYGLNIFYPNLLNWSSYSTLLSSMHRHSRNFLLLSPNIHHNHHKTYNWFLSLISLFLQIIYNEIRSNTVLPSASGFWSDDLKLHIYIFSDVSHIT